MKKLIWFSITIGITWLLIHSLAIVHDGLRNETREADIAIVLGSKVNEDGYPSLRLKSRLDEAIKLKKLGLIHKIFVSGGYGPEGYPEGTVMKNYLIIQGIEHDAIIVDNYGNNTHLTMENFMVEHAHNTFESTIIISQYFHLSRSKLALKQLGFKGDIYTAHAHFFEWRDVWSIIREFFAYYAYLFVY